jgi:hypothetical protein
VWRLTGKTYAADGSPMLPVPHGPNGHIAPVISRAPGIAVSRFFEDDGPDGLAGLIGFFYAMTSAWAIGDAIAKEVEPVLSEAAGRKVKVARGASEPLRFLVAFPEPRGDRIAPRTRRRTQDIWL